MILKVMFHLKPKHIPSHDSYSQHLHLAVPLRVQQAYLYLLHDTGVGQVKVLGYHFRDNNGSSFLLMDLIDPNSEGSEIITNLCQVPPMKVDGLETSANHPAEEMSAQVFLILRSPFNPINFIEPYFL